LTYDNITDIIKAAIGINGGLTDMRKKIFMGIVLVLIIAAAIFAYFQAIRPLSVKNVEAQLRELDGESGLDYYRQEYQKYLEGRELYYDEQYIRKNNVFPSENDGDYCHLTLRFTIKNRSLLNQYIITGIILCDDENSPLILKTAAFAPDRADPMSTNKLAVMSFLVYRSGMTDEELTGYMKKQTVVISYESRIKSGTIKVKLSDYRLDTYKGGNERA
jgi:hypothetical protein